MINESSELQMRETNPFSLLKLKKKSLKEFNHSNPFGVSIKMITLNNLNSINQSNIVSCKVCGRKVGHCLFFRNQSAADFFTGGKTMYTIQFKFKRIETNFTKWKNCFTFLWLFYNTDKFFIDQCFFKTLMISIWHLLNIYSFYDHEC